jgi:hypothetical protein
MEFFLISVLTRCQHFKVHVSHTYCDAQQIGSAAFPMPIFTQTNYATSHKTEQLCCKLQDADGIHGSSQHRNKRKATRHYNIFIPIIICLTFLLELFAFLYLQGDMNSWVAFMGGEASMGLFNLYCIIGIGGICTVVLLKKQLRILDA